MEFVLYEKLKPLIVVDGYQLNFHKTLKDGIKWWKCTTNSLACQFFEQTWRSWGEMTRNKLFGANLLAASPRELFIGCALKYSGYQSGTQLNYSRYQNELSCNCRTQPCGTGFVSRTTLPKYNTHTILALLYNFTQTVNGNHNTNFV